MHLGWCRSLGSHIVSKKELHMHPLLLAPMKIDIADAVEFGFEFQNGVRWDGEMDVVCDGSVIDVNGV